MNFVSEGASVATVTASGKNEMLFMGFNQDYGCFAVGKCDSRWNFEYILNYIDRFVNRSLLLCIITAD